MTQMNFEVAISADQVEDYDPTLTVLSLASASTGPAKRVRAFKALR